MYFFLCGKAELSVSLLLPVSVQFRNISNVDLVLKISVENSINIFVETVIILYRLLLYFWSM